MMVDVRAKKITETKSACVNSENREGFTAWTEGTALTLWQKSGPLMLDLRHDPSG